MTNTEGASPETAQTVVTCVYCGHEYPNGTPTAKAKELTEHIKVCESHPMREAERRIDILTGALSGLIGAESEDELKAMEATIRTTPAPAADKAAMLNAIHALLETGKAG